MPMLADDDVVVHGDAERLRHLDDRLVISTSAREGEGSPEGWLCTISLLAPNQLSRQKNSWLSRCYGPCNWGR